jgi:hypothetical protein
VAEKETKQAEATQEDKAPETAVEHIQAAIAILEAKRGQHAEAYQYVVDSALKWAIEQIEERGGA